MRVIFPLLLVIFLCSSCAWLTENGEALGETLKEIAPLAPAIVPGPPGTLLYYILSGIGGTLVLAYGGKKLHAKISK